MIIDALIERINELGNPTALGLDTDPAYLPEPPRPGGEAEAVLDFNLKLMEAVRDIVPSIKVQVAYYEAMGTLGMEAFAETLKAGKRMGFIVVADCKRNDIGPTARAYAKAYFESGAFPADFLTVNGYLGTDGIAPFLDYAPDKGVFALVKTSNPSGGELQDLTLQDGRAVYEAVADRVSAWGADFIGRHGYSAIGAVVGATYPEQGARLRKRMPHTFFLVPGYGAQGASGEALSDTMDENGGGIVVNASRSLLLAYRKSEHAGAGFAQAAREEAIIMRNDLRKAMEHAKKRQH